MKASVTQHTIIPNDRLATLKEQIKVWFATSPASVMFANSRGAATLAVLEYLANQEGHTVCMDFAKRDEAWFARKEAEEILAEEKRLSEEKAEREKQEAQRAKEEAAYQSAISKLTSKERKVLQKRFRR